MIETTQVTLQIDPQTMRDFQHARDQWERAIGVAPDINWLMTFALQTTDPIQTVEIADELALDYLKNKLELA
jgi:hypothetical protein